MRAILFNIQKFSIHDGPGIRTVVFFKGCHLNCQWCSNPESRSRGIQLSFYADRCNGCGECIEVCPESALRFQDGRLIHDPQCCTHCSACIDHCLHKAIAFYGKAYSVDEVVQEVLKDKAFYDKSGGGVTLSGGEVFLQADFARELCWKLSAEKINIAVETSLAVSPALFETLRDHVDTWLVDLKHHSEEKLVLGTGAKHSNFLDNLKQLMRRQANVTVRIPVIPGFNDSLQDAESFARLLKEIGISKAELLPFHQFGERKYELLDMPYSLKGIPQLYEDDLNEYSEIFISNNIQIQIGG